jgi:hypothetical protein
VGTPQPGPAIDPATVERWLVELGLGSPERHEREGAVAWDLVLDGRRRFDVNVTLIVDPGTGLVVWVHYAPPIGDLRIKSYRRLLRWNDEIPFAKFALASDDRPVLTLEVPLALLDRDALGIAVGRALAICDLLIEESAGWIWIGGRIPDPAGRVSRQRELFTRYADRIEEIGGS